jgi:hypothetical protein
MSIQNLSRSAVVPLCRHSAAWRREPFWPVEPTVPWRHYRPPVVPLG